MTKNNKKDQNCTKKTNKLDEEMQNDIETNVIVIVIVNLPKSNILSKQYHNQKKRVKICQNFLKVDV